MIDKSAVGARPRGQSLNFTRHRGFSMIELMMSVVLIAISAALAIPSYRDMVEKRQLTHGAEQIVALLNSAQGAAMKRNGMITVRADRDNDDDWCLGVASDGVKCDCSVGIESTNCKVDGNPLLIDESLAKNLSLTATSGVSDFYYMDFERGLFLPCQGTGDICEEILPANWDISDMDDPLVLKLQSFSGAFRLDVMIHNSGRIILCSNEDAHAVPGYEKCPPLEQAQQVAGAGL